MGFFKDMFQGPVAMGPSREDTTSHGNVNYGMRNNNSTTENKIVKVPLKIEDEPIAALEQLDPIKEEVTSEQATKIEVGEKPEDSSISKGFELNAMATGIHAKQILDFVEKNIPNIIEDEKQRLKIFEKFKEALQKLQKEKTSIISESEDTHEIWKAILEEAFKSVTVKDAELEEQILHVYGYIIKHAQIEVVEKSEAEKNLDQKIIELRVISNDYAEKVDEALSQDKFKDALAFSEHFKKNSNQVLAEMVDTFWKYDEAMKNKNVAEVDGLLHLTEELKTKAQQLILEISAWEKPVANTETKESNDAKEESLVLLDAKDLINSRTENIIEKINKNELTPTSIKIKEFTAGQLAQFNQEELEIFTTHINEANAKIKNIIEAKNKREKKGNKPSKKEVVQPISAETENPIIVPESQSEAWVADVEKALGKIKRMEMADAERLYGDKIIRVADNLEYDEVLRDILKDSSNIHVDSLAEPEKAIFENTMKYVKALNNDEIDIIVVNGKTYKYNKHESVKTENTPEDIEKRKEKIFEIALEGAREYRKKLLENLKENVEWKKMRKQYQDKFLEGQIVVFLDELFEKQTVITKAEKEEFVEKIVQEMEK
jgi:hypothetical protein